MLCIDGAYCIIQIWYTQRDGLSKKNTSDVTTYPVLSDVLYDDHVMLFFYLQ